MQYEQAKGLLEHDFKRLFGVHRTTFDEMVSVMQQRAQTKQKAGRSSKLSIQDQVLVTLQGAGVSSLFPHCPGLGCSRINHLPHSSTGRKHPDSVGQIQVMLYKSVG
jgi:hypothetical protein